MRRVWPGSLIIDTETGIDRTRDHFLLRHYGWGAEKSRALVVEDVG